MTRYARLLAFTLALLIAVTSQQMAMARGMAKDANGEVVLCTGQGTLTVALDSSGNPMGPVHICPDCALTFMAFADAPLAATVVVVHMRTLAQTPARALQSPVIPTALRARGPPLFV